MQNNDAYLTEYYFDGTGDQFYPGCPASVSEWFQRNAEEVRSFFPAKNVPKSEEENNGIRKN